MMQVFVESCKVGKEGVSNLWAFFFTPSIYLTPAVLFHTFGRILHSMPHILTKHILIKLFHLHITISSPQSFTFRIEFLHRT